VPYGSESDFPLEKKKQNRFESEKRRLKSILKGEDGEKRKKSA